MSLSADNYRERAAVLLLLVMQKSWLWHYMQPDG
jgi:hypothetical protein